MTRFNSTNESVRDSNSWQAKMQRFFEMSVRNINQKTRKGEGKESICQQEIVMVLVLLHSWLVNAVCPSSTFYFKEEEKLIFFKVREANWWRTGMLPAISQLHFCSWLNIFFFFPSNPPCLLFNCGGAILKRNSEVSYFLLAKILTQNSPFFCKLLRITFHS